MQSILQLGTGVFTSLLILAQGLCLAQSLDSINLLRPVIIYNNRGELFKVGYKAINFDSTDLLVSSNLGEVLQQNSNAFIKSYGTGNISTIALRGGGAAHTATLWNGFSLQNSLTGLTDFSLIPTGILSEVILQQGGSSALFGSGALSGIIHLNNNPSYENAISTKLSFVQSNYNTNQILAKATYSSNKSELNLSVYANGGANNYPFINSTLSDRPEQLQQHSGYIQKGVSTSYHRKISQFMQLSVWVWAQTYDRLIAPNLSTGPSKASQYDHFIRPALHWSFNKGKHQANTRVAFFNDYLHYKDDPKNIDSKFNVNNLILESDGLKKINNQLDIHFGINQTYTKGTSENYVLPQRSQSRMAVFSTAKLKLLKNNLLLNVSLRNELVDGKNYPITPGLSFDYKGLKNLIISGNISKNYRIPTFNDLYWKQGGNPSLKAEHGWSEEAGITYLTNFRRLSTTNKINIFNRKINDWLIWLPDNGVWTPHNLQKVWSRGVEYNLTLKYKIGKLGLSNKILYAYTLSTNEKTKVTGDLSLYKQLIYVPIHKTNTITTLKYKNFTIRHAFSYVGWRFVSSDNTAFLDPYAIHDLSLMFKSKITQSIQTDIFISVNNLLNVSYLAIADVPMPLRNYQLGISINFNQKLKKNEIN